MRVRMILPLLMLASCDPSGERIDASRRHSMLDAELSGRTAGATSDCIQVTTSQSLDLVDNRTLVYRAPGVTYVNRLENACPGLRATSRLIVEPTESQRYCRLDRIRAFDPESPIAGPICPLGRFTAYPRP